MYFLDPNRRPLAAGVYETTLTGADGAVVSYALRVTIDDRQASYQVTLADGTVADTLDRRFLLRDGVTGWWSSAGPETFWGTRADAAYAGWLDHVQRRLARHGFISDSDRQFPGN